ncbi:unnamed protein product, partial [Symbiodinium sp. KB8]
VEVCGGSYHCVEALIKARADVRAKAIHIAAGSGNHELPDLRIVRLLVENSANPESEVWFNQIKSVKMLLQRKAKVHDDMVEFLLYERTTFLKMKDGTSKKDGAQFSAFRLNLFTNAQLLDIESGDRAEAFLQVARNCPDAATACLDLEFECPSWTFSIQSAVNRVKKLCELIEVAPQSAVDLLDMLTAKPKVRANIPVDQEACRLSCVYITEMEWTWNASETKPPAWQDQLAPPDPKKSQEAATRDQRIFTKLVIHALLKHLWQAFRNGVGKDSGFQFVVMVKGFTLCIKLWYAEPTRTDQFAGCRCTLACVSSR